MSIQSLFNNRLLNMWNILSCAFDPRVTKSNKILFLPSSWSKVLWKPWRDKYFGPNELSTKLWGSLLDFLPIFFTAYLSWDILFIPEDFHHLCVQTTQLFSLLHWPFSGLQIYMSTCVDISTQKPGRYFKVNTKWTLLSPSLLPQCSRWPVEPPSTESAEPDHWAVWDAAPPSSSFTTRCCPFS